MFNLITLTLAILCIQIVLTAVNMPVHRWENLVQSIAIQILFFPITIYQLKVNSPFQGAWLAESLWSLTLVH